MLHQVLTKIKKWFTKSKPLYVVPSYAEVMTTLTAQQLTDCFKCLEVLRKHPDNKFAWNRLQNIASRHTWSIKVFIGIIEEEYAALHEK